MSRPILTQTVQLEEGGYLIISKRHDGKSAIWWLPSPTREAAGQRSPTYLGTASTSELAAYASGQARPSESVSSPSLSPCEVSYAAALQNAARRVASFFPAQVADPEPNPQEP